MTCISVFCLKGHFLKYTSFLSLQHPLYFYIQLSPQQIHLRIFCCYLSVPVLLCCLSYIHVYYFFPILQLPYLLLFLLLHYIVFHDLKELNILIWLLYALPTLKLFQVSAFSRLLFLRLFLLSFFL